MLGAARLTSVQGSSVPSYEAFVAAMTAKATSAALSWGSDQIGGPSLQPGKRITTATSAGVSMLGSPWTPANGDGLFSLGSGVGAVMRHGLPSAAVVAAQIAAGRVIYFETFEAPGTDYFQGVTRNGLASTTYAAPSGLERAFRLIDLIYYDAGPMRMGPFAGTGPTPYTLGTA